MTKTVKFNSLKKSLFLNKKLPIIYPYAFVKDVQATGEAFSPQNSTSSTPTMKFLHFFLFSWVTFALLDPNPAEQNQNRSGSTTLLKKLSC
jgi:hypothetical protein